MILFQYKRDEPIEHSLNYSNPTVQDHLNHNNHISHHLRYQRRTSLDSGSDSSSESEGKLLLLILYTKKMFENTNMYVKYEYQIENRSHSN